MNSREKAQTKEFKEFKELQEFKNAIRTRPWRKEHGTCICLLNWFQNAAPKF
jgi:hypothetical protein